MKDQKKEAVFGRQLSVCCFPKSVAFIYRLVRFSLLKLFLCALSKRTLALSKNSLVDPEFCAHFFLLKIF